MEARHARTNETRNMKTTVIQIKIAERCPLYDGRRPTAPPKSAPFFSHTGTDTRHSYAKFAPAVLEKHTRDKKNGRDVMCYLTLASQTFSDIRRNIRRPP
eukprot:scaffold63268_cov33-Prasinocladus_malaysianus.AAC.1